MQRRSFLAAVGALCGGGIAHAHPGTASVQRTARINGGWPMDEFALTDQYGRPFTRTDLHGRWTFVLFGDARGDERCTAALEALAGMCRRIARTQKLRTTQIVFVSLVEDPPERLRAFLAPYDERFRGASGPAPIAAHLADDLGVDDAAPLAFAEQRIDGTGMGILALVDPEGMVWGQFLPPFDDMLLTARYLKSRIGR